MKLSNSNYDIVQEEWKAIDGFEGFYEVSNFGKIKSLERRVMNNGGLQRRHEKILKEHHGPTGHCLVVLCKDGKTYPRLVHRLVAVAFIPNPEDKPVVDHIDTNPMNNRIDNLRWVTTKENCNNELTRKHNSESKTGRVFSEEARRKMSEARKRYYKKIEKEKKDENVRQNI